MILKITGYNLRVCKVFKNKWEHKVSWLGGKKEKRVEYFQLPYLQKKKSRVKWVKRMSDRSVGGLGSRRGAVVCMSGCVIMEHWMEGENKGGGLQQTGRGLAV